MNYPDGFQFPGGHTQLTPQQDPHRLTTYSDFREWAINTRRHAALTGGTQPQAILDLIPFLPQGFFPPGDPATWNPAQPTVPNMPDTTVESGESANQQLLRGYKSQPDKVVISGGRAYVKPPGPGEGWPHGVKGGAYNTITVMTNNPPPPHPEVVIDPDNLAIARDWDHPNTPPVQATFQGPAVATELSRLGFSVTTVPNPSGGPPLIVAPENTPDKVAGIGYPTRTVMIGGNPVRVISPDGPVIVRHWP
jgi:hypothetical protein